jgi:hypothetical protein
MVVRNCGNPDQGRIGRDPKTGVEPKIGMLDQQKWD